VPPPGRERTRAEPRRPPSPGLDSFGRFRLPGSGEKATGTFETARLVVAGQGDGALGLGMQNLVRQVLSRLDGRKPPFVLLATAVRTTAQSAAAARLLAMSLQHVGARVLLIDVLPPEGRSNRLKPLASQYVPAPMPDAASGVPAIAVSASRLQGNAAAELSAIIREAGTEPQFVVVAGRPLGEPAYQPGLAQHADLELFALSPADEQSGLLVQQMQRLGATEPGRKAMVAIGFEEQPRARRPFRPRLVVSNDNRKLAAAAG
jgi:hypothetical protein